MGVGQRREMEDSDPLCQGTRAADSREKNNTPSYAPPLNSVDIHGEVGKDLSAHFGNTSQV